MDLVVGALVAGALIGLAGTIWVKICVGIIEKNRVLWGISALALVISAIALGNHLFVSTVADIAKDYTKDVATTHNAEEATKMDITLNYRKDISNPYYMPLTSWITTGYCVMDAGMTNGENLGFAYEYNGSSTLNRIASPRNMIRHGLGYIVMNNVGDNFNNDKPVLSLVCGTTKDNILGYVFLKSEMAKYCPPNSTAYDIAEYLDSNLIFEPNTVVSKELYTLYEYIFESMQFKLSKPLDIEKDTQLIGDYDYENRVITVSDVE